MRFKEYLGILGISLMGCVSAPQQTNITKNIPQRTTSPIERRVNEEIITRKESYPGMTCVQGESSIQNPLNKDRPMFLDYGQKFILRTSSRTLFVDWADWKRYEEGDKINYGQVKHEEKWTTNIKRPATNQEIKWREKRNYLTCD